MRALFGLLRISGGEVEINGQPVPLSSSSDAIRYGIYMLPEEHDALDCFGCLRFVGS
jgi:ABC-type uncharacterized transport system ATPase subunit